MKLIDPDHPFFVPIWRRWVTVLVPGLWAAIEFAFASPGWGILFGAAAVYAWWMLIWVGPTPR
jgi:hypothetical protein